MCVRQLVVTLMIIGFLRRVNPASVVSLGARVMIGIVLQLGIADTPGAERGTDSALVGACANPDKR